VSRTFIERLETQWAVGHHICVGLDIALAKVPAHIKGEPAARAFTFLQGIIDSTSDLAAAYKPNSAFFEALGGQGPYILADTIRYAKRVAPNVPIIVDAKRADIAHTNDGTIAYLFDFLGADATTVHPYLGQEALRPFLDLEDKGVFVLCRTSNPGAGELQDLQVMGGDPLFIHLAGLVASEWNSNSNCGLVAGATYPDELRLIRQRASDLPLLIPGIGAQGGDLEATVRAAHQPGGLRVLVNASRSVLYASSGEDFDAAAASEVEILNRDIARVLANLAT
jgi:orotidine-5'-phosphate decarboxylase